MGNQLTVTAEVTSIFDKAKLEQLLDSKGASKREIKDQYQEGAWTLGGLSITLYTKKLVIQGKNESHHTSVISEICSLDGLQLDHKNKSLLSSSLPKLHNSTICKDCQKPSLIIEAVIDGLDIKFRRECSHMDKMNTPLLTINNRILPDTNMLISRSLSRLIELGYFDGFEIIIPKFVMNVIDSLGGEKKSSVTTEITALKNLESNGKISVRDFNDKNDNMTELLPKEDDVIIEISDLTNSILVTGDGIMKSKAQIKNRPVIFIDARYHLNIKNLNNVRT